jgi:threonylcarbamoyladenosine tRNA methylthiotransferase CDKAL1
MKKILIKTYGCSFNAADSENMSGLLEEAGYKLVTSEDDADLVIINSCTVKNNAETKFWRDVKNIKKPKILAGCVPQAEQDKKKFKDYSIIGTHQITNVVHVVEETLSGNIVQLLKNEHNPRLNIPKIRKNSIIEIIPINEGCLGNCSFCKTKFARGHLFSYDSDEIAKQARYALNDGAKEIWLTSQDTACYGYDIDTNIVHLLEKILEMKRDFKIRLGMGNPDYMPDYLDELIEIFRDDRMFKFIHVPLQAGSDKVLKDMKRGYTAKSFLDITNKFRKSVPDITIATDVICGYPGETDKDFEDTINLIKKTKPDVVNISRFWSRPGTIAAKQKQLQSKVIKERGIELTKLFYKISEESNKKWLGWKGMIIIDEIGKNKTFVGRNYAYKPVVVKGNFKLGDTPLVEIVDTKIHDLRAKQIKTL